MPKTHTFARLASAGQGRRLFLLSWMAYAAAYVGRYNYSAVMSAITAEGTLTLSAAGAETALGVLKKTKDDGVVFVRYRPMEVDEAEEILRQCVRLFDESFDLPVIWPDSYEDSVFWRGLDIKKARDLRERVEEDIAALLAPLAEVTATSSDETSESTEAAEASDKPKKGKSTKKKTSLPASEPHFSRAWPKSVLSSNGSAASSSVRSCMNSPKLYAHTSVQRW